MESLFFDNRRGFGRDRFKESLVAFEIILLLSLLYHARVEHEGGVVHINQLVRACCYPVSSAARERFMSRPAEKASEFDYN